MLLSFLSTFGLLSFYRRGVIRRLVTVFYLYGGDSDRQNRFDQSKISNFGHQYVSGYCFIIFFFHSKIIITNIK